MTMVTFVVALIALVYIVSTLGMMLKDFTPGRRTRGIARWWARCWRWTGRLSATRRRDSAESITGELIEVPWFASPGEATYMQAERINRNMKHFARGGVQ